MIDEAPTSIEPTAQPPDGYYLIVGLGNPGRAYRGNRHNIGFMLIDRLVEKSGIKMSRMQSRAIVGTGTIEGIKVILAKPQTFMNLSGQSVAGLVKFFKIPLNQILVVHDEMDLPFGTIRIRASGGSAGQKGLTSVIERLGTKEFPRCRLGVGHPAGPTDAVDHLLDDFTSTEKKELVTILDTAAEAVTTFLTKGIEKAMTVYNGPSLKD